MRQQRYHHNKNNQRSMIQIMNLRVIILIVCIFILWIVSYLVLNNKNDNNNSIFSYRYFNNNNNKNEKIISTNNNFNWENFIPIEQPVTSETTVTFYAHGDVPYTRIQARKLKKQMIEMKNDITTSNNNNNIDFMIHLGDIRMAGPNRDCTISEYTSVSSLLQLSPIPVFIILGDNDVNDCPDPITGYQLWNATFSNYETMYWKNHSLITTTNNANTYTNHYNNTNSMIIRPKKYPDNFKFVYKNILFIGVNIVGVKMNEDNVNELTHQLTEQVEWVMEVIDEYYINCVLYHKIIGRIVLFYHANPGPSTRPFFKPLRHYIGNTLNHSTPILFLNGDAHRYMYQPRFYNESSLLRITVSGLAVDPLLKITIPMDGLYHPPTEAFQIDRRLASSTDVAISDPVH